MHNKLKILILDGNQRSALAATRSLGRRGLTVLVAESAPVSLAGCSNLCHKSLRYPPPEQDAEVFVQHLAELIHQESIDTLLPMTDATTSTVLRHRAQLGEVQLPYPAFSAYDNASNKVSLFKRAEYSGVPTPTTHYINGADELARVLSELKYPVVIKPDYSRILYQNQWCSTSVNIVQTELELLDCVRQTPWLQERTFMLQEYIQGQGQGLFALYSHGEPVAFFCHRRLREKPPTGGVSVYCESMPVDPAMRKVAEKILGDLDWHGVAMVEFKVAKDGTAYLMEINARFWGSLELAVRAGVDFPYLLTQIANGQTPAQVEFYRQGQRLRWLLGDLDHLYLVLKSSSRQIPLSSKLETVLKVLTTSPFGTDHDTFRLNDPGPFYHELKQYFGTE